MNMETLDLSIIIPTYNGRHKVLNCLRALQPQMRPGMEAIVVVDGSTDGTVRMLQQHFGRCAWLRVLQTENQGRARARNNGARNARGSILLFLDDDIEPGHLFIVRHMAAHAGREKAWVTGPVHQKIVDVPHADFLRFRSRHDIAGARAGAKAGELVRVAMFSTQQISVRARDFQAVGGFLSQLSDTEDFELSVRATDAGHAILFDAANPVHHCDFANVAQFIRRQNEYRASKDRLARANPRLAARYPEVFEARPDGRHVKGLLRPLFVYNRFWDKLFSSKARLVLPLGIRMRMFDYVISSTEWAAARSAQGVAALEATR